MALFSSLRLVVRLFFIFSFTASIQANPINPSTCKDPYVRQEWRELSVLRRLQYIAAVKCLMAKPPVTSKTDLPGVTNHYEDFLGTHIAQADYVHFVGVFYPFHRLMWDWTLDTVSPTALKNSPIFDPITGFGGNGPFVPGNISNPAPGLFAGAPFDIPDRTGGGCITDGPFVHSTIHMGPGGNLSYNPHCIRRDFAPITLKNNSGSAAVATAMALPDYGYYELTTEFSLHPGGHWGIGGLYGTMADKWASVGDPLFYLHHANVDRAWWSWQAKDLNNRLTDMSGPLVAFDYADQTPGSNATLSSVIRIGTTVNVTTTVSEVMNIQAGLLCYKYDKLY